MSITFLKLEDEQIVSSTENNAVWIHAEVPTAEELDKFEQITEVPKHILGDIQDIYEMPHIDTYKDHLVVFIDIPVEIADATPKNQTRPMCLILKDEQIYSITNSKYSLIEQIKTDHAEAMTSASDLFIAIIHTVLYSYITNIKRMEDESNWKHDNYKNSSHNENMIFFELLDFQKSLIDFETSIDANQLTIQSLKDHQSKRFTTYQSMLIDNLLIETAQLERMCTVFGEVLNATASMSETILSNHLNNVMKKLTSITILFSVPTIIMAIFTVNLNIPAQWAIFEIPIVIAAISVVVTLIVLRKRKML